MGPWYAVNDMAITRCAKNYLCVTGDFAWLDKRIGDKTALDHLLYHATYWKELDKNSHGLGDYGKLENNLEVVSTYLHESAGMNAGNVSSMRFVAGLLERRGDSSRAAQLRSEAKDLAQRINQKLYVAGKGYWQCGYPDGSFVVVRHCYDFLSVLDNMHSGAEFGISQAAMLHLAASLPNLVLAPDSHYHHLTDDIIEGGKMKYKNGAMTVPTGPGLGVSLDRDKLARYHELSKRQEMGSWIQDPRKPGAITMQPKW